MKHTFIPVFCAIMVTALFPCGALASPTASSGVLVRDIDGRNRDLRKSGKVSVVMYTNADLEEQSRTLSSYMDSFRPRSDFAFIQVLDMRGEVPPIVRNTVVKEVKRHLDKEAARLAPIYRKSGANRDPRKDLSTVVDFSGNVLGSLNWGNHYDDVRLLVYNKKGELVKRWDQMPDAESLRQFIKRLL